MVEAAKVEPPKADKELTAQLLRDRLAPVRHYKVSLNGISLRDSHVVIDINKQEVQFRTPAMTDAKK